MCLAGVFGGLDSGVTEQTTEVFLESAYFDPVSIRKTAKRHGLSTDASFRYERGIDIELVKYSLRRAAILFKKLQVEPLVQKLLMNIPSNRNHIRYC